MPINRTTNKNGWAVTWNEYTLEEIKTSWEKLTSKHDGAYYRKENCVITLCGELDALILSRWFIHKVNACLYCTHYDGITLSLYCGEAGSAHAIELMMTRTESYIEGYYNTNLQ